MGAEWVPNGCRMDAEWMPCVMNQDVTFFQWWWFHHAELLFGVIVTQTTLYALQRIDFIPPPPMHSLFFLNECLLVVDVPAAISSGIIGSDSTLC